MKWFKRIIISIVVIFFVFAAFYKTNKINLDGDWKIRKIVFDGKKIYPDTLVMASNIGSYINIGSFIKIDNFSQTIFISINGKTTEAHLEYLEPQHQNTQVKLSSNEKSLNGVFDVTIETSDVSAKSYIVDVELKSHQTLICFQKQVIIPPLVTSSRQWGRPY
uniref:hypothetical protein n=1 Tax=Flavobacterium sp. TaxID=239 RepID=UPI00404ADD85